MREWRLGETERDGEEERWDDDEEEEAAAERREEVMTERDDNDDNDDRGEEYDDERACVADALAEYEGASDDDALLDELADADRSDDDLADDDEHDDVDDENDDDDLVNDEFVDDLFDDAMFSFGWLNDVDALVNDLFDEDLLSGIVGIVSHFRTSNCVSPGFGEYSFAHAVFQLSFTVCTCDGCGTATSARSPRFGFWFHTCAATMSSYLIDVLEIDDERSDC